MASQTAKEAEYRRRYRSKPEVKARTREKQRLERSTRPELKLVRDARKRARKRNWPTPSITPQWVAEEMRRQNNRCRLCLVEFKSGTAHRPSPQAVTLDVKRPETGEGYTTTNTGVLCFACNRRKNTLTTSEMEALLDYARH